MKSAHEMIDRLLREDLDRSGQDYLDVLAGLVEAYEDLHFPIPDAPEADVLRELIKKTRHPFFAGRPIRKLDVWSSSSRRDHWRGPDLDRLERGRYSGPPTPHLKLRDGAPRSLNLVAFGGARVN